MDTITIHGREFNIEKRGKEWQTNYRDAKATIGSTKAEAVTVLKEYDRDKLIEGCDAMDKQLERDQYFKDNINIFTAIFGFAPPKDFSMYHMGCGMQLDVIALDKKLRTPDGISTSDHILKVYGSKALEMVRRMI